MPFDPADLQRFPKAPGVYLMKNEGGKVLYVGKANNLQKRLKQYFTPLRDERPHIEFLIPEIATIDTLVVATEKEALILENNLIKRHQPKYNILLKDDKSYISLLLTKHPWPLLKLVRYKTPPKTGTLFGPYTNARSARQLLDLIFQIFPLRQCSDGELASRTRPCILYDMKRCIAPCKNLCSKEEYGMLVSGVTKLLRGEDQSLIKELKEKMERASEALEFEKANHYLKLLKQIEHMTEMQHVERFEAKDVDLIGLHRQGNQVMLVTLHYEQGKLVASEHFSFFPILQEDSEILTSFLLQHYQKNFPKEIYLPCEIENQEAAEEILRERANSKISLLSPKKGDKRNLVHLAQKNAEALFHKEKELLLLDETKLLHLQEILSLNRFPKKIECFDTSNFAMAEPVAAMVTYINGKLVKDKMRLFSIKKATKADDYTAMREVLLRHYQKERENNDLPDLLIIDGGKGHLHLAQDVLSSLNIASIDLIGLAKQEGKHTKGLTEEQVFVPYQDHPILIDPTSPLLFLLQNIRDEAHRVAIGFQRKKMQKKQIKSTLDDIPGIGPIKKKRLLTHFKSIARLKEATLEELLKVPGLTKRDIETLIQFRDGK